VGVSLTAEELEARRRQQVFVGIFSNPCARASSERDEYLFDMDQALLLVETHKYYTGQLWLFEKMGMYQMVVQHFLERISTHKANGNVLAAADCRQEVVRKCLNHGDKDPNIWVQVLTHFANSYTGWDREEESIKEVLQHVEEDGLLPPMRVVKVVVIDSGPAP
jgi:vacuolar protein sorting-associated protein 11